VRFPPQGLAPRKPTGHVGTGALLLRGGVPCKEILLGFQCVQQTCVHVGPVGGDLIGLDDQQRFARAYDLTFLNVNFLIVPRGGANIFAVPIVGVR